LAVREWKEVGKPVFARHEIACRTSKSFRMDGSWFRGAEVDCLSLEEAREIAETSVASAAKEKLVSPEEGARIKSDIEAYFRKELLKSRTRQELLQDAKRKFPEAVLNIFRKHIGTERTAELEADGIENPFNRVDRGEPSTCCP
jgi:hypothetical protein